MHMKAVVCLLLALTFVNAAERRLWTDLQDRKIEGTLTRIDGQTVFLQLKDGRQVQIPLAKLSAADGVYVAENAKTLTTASTLAAAATAPTPAAHGAKLNFSDPWPERIRFTEDPEVSTIEEDAVKKRFIYESANYRYTCDVRLAQSVVKGFAVMFEATHLFCRTLPIALNGGRTTQGKHEILLFEEFSSYVQAGGPPDSAGVFIGGKDLVMVPLTSLGVRPVGSSYMLDRDKSSKTLPHELAHQLTPNGYFEKGALGWFSEGIAEYIAVTPYRSGSYAVRGNQKEIFEYVTAYGANNTGGKALGTKIKLGPLKEFMLQSYDSFLENSHLSYGCGLLLTNYFLHMDGAGDGKRIRAYLEAIQKGGDSEKSLDVLLDGRSFALLETEIAKALGRKGVEMTF